MLTSVSRILLYCVFFLLPFTFIRLFNNLALSDVILTFSFIVLAISSVGRKFLLDTVLANNPFLFPLLIFSIGFFISINNSVLPLESITAYLQIVFIFVIAYPVLAEVVKDEQQISIIAILLIIPGVVISILMLLLKFIGIDIGIDLLAYEGWRGRFSYGGMEPNIPGRIILQNIPLLAVIAIITKKYSTRIIAILLIMVQLLAIILTSSRSNMLTFSIGLILFVLFTVKSGRKIRIRQALFALALISIITAILYNINDEFFVKPFERYSTILDAGRSASSMERLRVIDLGLNYLDTNPFIGVGLSNSYLYTKVSVHNPILLTWYENGIFGVIGFTGFYLVLLFQGYRCYKNRFYSSDILLGLTVVMIMMVFGDMFMANSYKRVLWLPALLFFVHAKNRLSTKIKLPHV